MNKKAMLLCLLLGACAMPGKRGREGTVAVYDLGAPAVRQAAAAGVPPLAVETRAPTYWSDFPGIRYRLAYAEPGRLQVYGQARWAAPAALLVQQRLAQQLGLVPLGQGRAACLVRIDLDEFSQVFDTPETSRGLLQARVALLDGSRVSLAETAVKIEKPAPSPDSRGGVAALTAAVEQLGGELGRWEGELAAQGRFKGCR